jgi:hypothetical protein
MGRTQAAISDVQVARLARELHVSPDSLRTLGLGWASTEDLAKMRASGAGWAEDQPDAAYAFPERSGDGRLVGFSLRAVDGRKGAPSGKVGARRGLIVPSSLDSLPEPVLIVEGASDVAACATMGLAAVGRPSCRSGADDLARLLRGRDVLVVGERDGKPDGRWPGRDGADAIAKQLATAWGEPVAWALPPEGAKDIRAWLGFRIEAGLDLADGKACSAAGQDLVAGMQKTPHQAKAQRPSAAESLVRLALDRYGLGQTETGEPFAVERDGPNIALMFRGSRDALRSTLAREFRRRYGKTPNAAALADAMTVLQGEALDADPEVVGLRLADHDGGVVIDLGDPQGRAVVVRPGGWKVVARSPVLFRRTALTSAMPLPDRGGSLDGLRGLLNVTDETWPLVRGWLVSALLPSLPHPVLMLGGEQGTGKTTTARMLVGLVDPSPAPLRSEPRDPEGWALAAAGSWAVAVDNVSKVTGWWSDALCRAVSGDGWLRRRLYTDGDLAVVSFRRVVLLTSIDPGALRADLGDRLLLVDLERIEDGKRQTEADLDRAYALARPQLLGGLLDALADVLSRLPHVALRELPRMADFARVLAALDDVDGADGRAFSAYVAQRGRIAADVVDADPVAAAVLKLVEDAGCWQGTAGELLQEIAPDRPPHGWPATPRAMAGRLSRLTPALRAIGIEIEYDRVGHARSRQYTIRRTAQSTVRTVRTGSA